MRYTNAMLSISHTIISLPLGIIFQNPIIAFVAAFYMHLVCDHLLHWNIYPHKMKRYPFEWVALDVIGGIFFSYLIMGQQFFSLSILAAIAGGNMPDVLHGIWSFLRPSQQQKFPLWVHTWFTFHERIQRETDSVPAGLVSQVTLSGIAIILIRLFLH